WRPLSFPARQDVCERKPCHIPPPMAHGHGSHALAAPCNRRVLPVSFRPWGVGCDQEGTMGLLDVINGMQQGPRGPSTPSAQGGRRAPMTMGILGLLAWKAVKHLTAGQPGAAGQKSAPSQTGSKPAPAPSPAAAGAGGGLDSVLKGSLGGLLGGAA